MHFYMYVKGQKSGQITGGVTQKGREGSSLCSWFELGVEVPFDVNSGLSSGKRAHQPVKIRKQIDQASPLLYNMAVTNELATSVILKFWKTGTPDVKGGSGSEVQYYTVELANATIHSVRQYTQDDHSTDARGQTSTWEYEEIQFSFQKITVTWTQGGKVATDDWESPV